MPASKENQNAKKWTDEKLEELCNEMMSFAREEKTFHIVEFCLRKGHSDNWIHELASRYPIVSETLKKAQKTIGNKILVGGMTNELNQLFSSRYLGFYLKDIKQYERDQKEWELQKKAEYERKQDENYASQVETLNENILKLNDNIKQSSKQ